MFFIGFSISPFMYIGFISLYISYLLYFPHYKVDIDAYAPVNMDVMASAYTSQDYTVAWQDVSAKGQVKQVNTPFYEQRYTQQAVEWLNSSVALEAIFATLIYESQQFTYALFSRPPPSIS